MARLASAWAQLLTAVVLFLLQCVLAQRNLTADSSADFLRKFREHRKSAKESEVGALRFTNVTPYRDRFCYRMVNKKSESGATTGEREPRRIGVCMRAAILKDDRRIGFVFVDSKGIYTSTNESNNYVLVESSLEGTESLSARYERNQLGPAGRLTPCDDFVPETITLPDGRKVTAASKTFRQCQRICLSLETLSQVRHVQIAKPVLSPVFCLRGVCGTGLHRLRLDGGPWETFYEVCRRENCVEKITYVAKAALATQRRGAIEFGMVYGEGIEFLATSFAQRVVDALSRAVFLPSWRLCASNSPYVCTAKLTHEGAHGKVAAL